MNEDLQAQSDTEHARCWRQLPWWVNGTLSSDEANRIEQHVTACRECTAELELQRALQAQLRDGDPVLMAPQSAWQSMSARLDSEDEALARGHFKLGSGTGSARRWAVAAQALLIVGLTTVVWQQAKSPDVTAERTDALLQPRYETLTSNSEVAPEGVVRVVFRPDATLVAVNALLRELSTQIVAGPTEAGVYMLSMPSPAVNGSSDQAALLKSLRGDARVIFAEPGEHRQ